MSAVDINHLTVTFKRGPSHFNALEMDGLQIKAGECFGLIGGSGSGKSTLLRVLAGLQRDWQGEVQVLGQPLNAQKAFTGALRSRCKWSSRPLMLHCIHCTGFVAACVSRGKSTACLSTKPA